MRLSDLILFIRLASGQYDQAQLDDKLRLSLIKRAFPRPDLLAWVDDAVKKPVAPRFYFPFLLICVAAQIALREGRDHEVARVSQQHLNMLGAFPRPPESSLLQLSSTSPGMIDTAAMPPSDRIGLIEGVFLNPQLMQELLLLRSLDAANAYRVFIMNAACYRTWRVAMATASGSSRDELFHGVLQYWGDRKTYIFYSPGNEAGSNERSVVR